MAGRQSHFPRPKDFYNYPCVTYRELFVSPNVVFSLQLIGHEGPKSAKYIYSAMDTSFTNYWSFNSDQNSKLLPDPKEKFALLKNVRASEALPEKSKELAVPKYSLESYFDLLLPATSACRTQQFHSSTEANIFLSFMYFI